MVAATYPRLLGDIGGTNARFAWQAHPDAPLSGLAKFRNDAHASLRGVIEHYLQGRDERPKWAAIGMANPVWGDTVRLTNRDWSFSISALQRELGLQRLLVINDFVALAMALPALEPAQLEVVGGGTPVPGAPKVVLGAGTGLGASATLPAAEPGRWIVLPSEAGHTTLPTVDEREDAVLAILRRRFAGHVSVERAVSGPGLVHLHEAVCILAGVAPAQIPRLTPAQVSERGLSGQDARCAEALELFFSFLGTVAGNLALTLDARGGVYIGGGVVPKLQGAIHRSRFRERFEGKGRFGERMRTIPTWVIANAEVPALMGAARALDQLP